ncbi:hypothetical protein OAL00_02580 [Verrucomicrobiales bacterium]|nr:hypothetical protein [Verrucomicrobiales bacterium]
MNKSSRVRRSIRLLLASFFAVAVASSLIAHEQKTALTDIFYNERTGNLEIAHRVNVHDAEHALKKATDSRADLTRSAKAREAFSDYAAERFAISIDKTNKLKLKLVGQELERGYLWIYQETKIPSPTNASFYIENSILHDAVKGQLNTVNVRFRKKVSTLEFEADSGAKLYSRGKDQEVLKSE